MLKKKKQEQTKELRVRIPESEHDWIKLMFPNHGEPKKAISSLIRMLRALCRRDDVDPMVVRAALIVDINRLRLDYVQPEDSPSEYHRAKERRSTEPNYPDKGAEIPEEGEAPRS